MPKYNPNSIWAQRTPDDAVKRSQTPTQPAKPATKVLSDAPAVAAEGAYFKKTPVKEFDESPAPKSRVVLWSVIGVVVVVGGVGAYLLFFRPTVSPNVTITFSKPDQILVGDPFTLSVTLSNDSSGALQNAMLSVLLPANVSFAGQSATQSVMQQTIGNIEPGSINDQDFNLIVTGDPNSVEHITTQLTYSTASSAKNQFETDGAVDVTVGGPAISLNILPPPSIFSGQNFNMTLSYANNTSHSFNDVELTMQYPPVFNFIQSSLPSDSLANDSWNLGTIPAAGTGNITIIGNVVGPANAIYSLAGNLTGEVMGDTYPLINQTANIAIGSSPLSLSILLNNSSSYVSSAGDTLNYVLTYTNNSSVTFQNVAIKATLVGAMFDFTTLNSNGAFNSVTNAVTWSGANTPQLLNLTPGETGSVSLQIKTKSSFPIRLLSDKDYTLNVNGQISSPTVPPGTSASSTVSVTSATNDVGGAITILAKGFWRDAASGMLNSGPYPPKVNQQTDYTIHWDITNYSTDANNVTVSAYLQSGTTCTGKITSTIASSTPICNAANGLVTWTIPFVPATTGVIDPPAEAVFQVENTPAINQVGQPVTLLGATTLQATDAFTGETLSATAPPVTTDLPYDLTVAGIQNRTVTQ